MVSEAISKGDTNAINYFVAQKYVEAFGQFAQSPNTKTIIVPAELTGIAGTVGGISELIKAVNK
jgi:regulator of protease activity HflC (stomatin/prohibitin superfamily)